MSFTWTVHKSSNTSNQKIMGDKCLHTRCRSVDFFHCPKIKIFLFQVGIAGTLISLVAPFQNYISMEKYCKKLLYKLRFPPREWGNRGPKINSLFVGGNTIHDAGFLTTISFGQASQTIYIYIYNLKYKCLIFVVIN